MAKPRTAPRPTTDDAEAPADEAEAVEEQQQDEEPTDAAPEDWSPTQVDQDGVTAYSIERLIDEAPAILGVESYVAAGALADTEEKFMTADDAKATVDAWLKKEAD